MTFNLPETSGRMEYVGMAVLAWRKYLEVLQASFQL